MIYRVLADLVVAVHLAFVVFAVVGGFLALRWRRLPWFHLPALAWAALVELLGWVCPLTPIENLLRQASGAAGYSAGFIEHYLVPVIYPEALTREIQLLLGVVLLLINGVAYWLVWRRHARSTASWRVAKGIRR